MHEKLFIGSSEILCLCRMRRSQEGRKAVPSEIPLINGSIWALQLIPIVIDVLDKNAKLTKKVQRDLLRKQFETKFVEKTKDGWITKEGNVLNSEDALRRHLDWTWLDQFAIPMCTHLRIIVVTRENYRLSNFGERLAHRLGDPSFDDVLRYVIIRVDDDNWGVLRILLKSSLDLSGLKHELDEADVRVRKDEHLRKYLHLLAVAGLVKGQLRKPVTIYEIEKERYERCRKLLKYKAYEDIDEKKFIQTLYKVYQDKTRSGSSFVDIDDLRSAVSRSLDWPEYFFTRRLETIPLRVGPYQLLFSQAAFPTANVGVERKGQYYNYLSIYRRTSK